MKLEWINCYYCYYNFYYYYYYYYYCCCCCSLSPDHPFQVYYKVRQILFQSVTEQIAECIEWLPPTTRSSNCVQPRQFFFCSIWTDLLWKMTWNLLKFDLAPAFQIRWIALSELSTSGQQCHKHQYVAESASWQDKEIKRILCSDWLPLVSKFSHINAQEKVAFMAK